MKRMLRGRAGIAPVFIAIVVVIVVAVAGVGTYVYLISASGTTSGSTTVSTSSTLLTTTSGVQGYHNYKGSYSYTNPQGPFGVNDSGGVVQEWNSTQTVSGTFTFSINPATYTGTGTGQGTITVATHGYCTGSKTVQYSFTIQAVWPPGENMTLSFNTPTPSDVMVTLTCQGSTQGFNEANNPVTYLSVYPNGLYLGVFPATVSAPLSNGISYTVTITQTS